jgi:hypothetical protein
MRSVIFDLKCCMVVILAAGLFGVVDAQANTSAEEVLKDSPLEELFDTSDDVGEAPVSEDAIEPQPSDETEATTDETTDTEPTPVNDYGDELLNQLYTG